MAAMPPNSKAPALSSTLPLSNHIQTNIDFPAAYGEKTVQVGSDKAGTAESKYDKQAVDIVVICASGGNTDAEQVAVFDSKKQSTPQKSTKSNSSDPGDHKSRSQRQTCY